MKHGTVSGYCHFGCRCDDCRRAAIQRQERYRYRVMRFGPDRVPAEPVLDHIERLHESGWRYAHIADEIGMDRMNFRRLRVNRRPLVTRRIADAVLALAPLEPVDVDPIVVDRLVAGADWRAIGATMAERLEAASRLSGAHDTRLGLNGRHRKRVAS